MKKIKQLTSTVLPTAKIFFDDLVEIDRILKESSLLYTITIDEYELDSIDEIKKIEEKQNFHSLKIEIMKPYFSLNIDKYNTCLSSCNDSLSIGIIERIKPIIHKRRKNDVQWQFYIFSCLFNFLLVVITLSDAFINLYSDSIGNIILGTIIVLNIICIGFLFKGKSSKLIVFTIEKSNEKNNYFIKNKEELITKLFFGIITTAIGIFIGNRVIPWFTSLLTAQ